MTNEELKAIRERAEAATPGPWIAEGETVYSSGVLIAGTYPAMICDDCDITEAEFIAHAREDVPKLLAEIERLRSALEEISEINEYYSGNAAREALKDDSDL
jgi:hypothetical protein